MSSIVNLNINQNIEDERRSVDDLQIRDVAALLGYHFADTGQRYLSVDGLFQ